MGDVTPSKIKVLGNRLFVFFGSGWLLVEVFNFVVERYGLDPVLLDHFIIIVVFGLPATLIYSFFKGKFNKIAMGLQGLNAMLLIALLFYFLSNPLALNPGKLRIIKLYESKSTALQSLNSLAVLPFSNNMGNDKDLLAGMHSGLINEICQLGSIRAIPGTSTLPYQNTTKSVKEIASELNVDAIIETSITKIDTVIELRINLIKAFPDELVVWSHSYTTSMNELPNLYKEVTKNVALKINNILLPEEEERLQPTRVPNPGAYEAVLRGGIYMGHLTKTGFELAKTQFEKAIEIDSLFAPAYGGFAAILLSAKQMGYVSGLEVNPVIDSLYMTAFAMDSLSPFVLMGIGSHLTWSKYEWEEAEEFFKKSIALNPNLAGSRAPYAHYLMILGRWDEAWVQMDYAMKLDPLDPWVLAFSAGMYFENGKMLSADKQLQRLIEIAPNHPMANLMLLGKYASQGKHELAVIELKKYTHRTGAPDLESIIDHTHKNGNFNETVRSVAVYLENYSKEHFVAPSIIHFLYKILDDREKQLEWMLKMYDVKDGYLPYLAIRKDEPIQKDPMYELIMKEIGLW